MRTGDFDTTVARERLAESKAFTAKRLADKKAQQLCDAAPELLEALEALLKECHDYYPSGIWTGADCSPAAKRAKAVIAKTEGTE